MLVKHEEAQIDKGYNEIYHSFKSLESVLQKETKSSDFLKYSSEKIGYKHHEKFSLSFYAIKLLQDFKELHWMKHFTASLMNIFVNAK